MAVYCSEHLTLLDWHATPQWRTRNQPSTDISRQLLQTFHPAHGELLKLCYPAEEDVQDTSEGKKICSK